MNEKFFDLKKEKQDRMINGAMKVFALNGFQRASTDEMVKEAGHRRVVSIIVCVIALIVLLASEKLMDLLDIDDMIACIFLIVFVVAFLVFICFSKYNKCPYCDKHMYRRGAWAVNNCPHCGGRIR